MVVWGGHTVVSLKIEDTTYHGTGAIYDPAARAWTEVTTVNAPSARSRHSAVWTGSQMIVWGGFNGGGSLADGGAFE